MEPVEPTIPLEPDEYEVVMVPAQGDEGRVAPLTVIRTKIGHLSEWSFTDEEREAIAEGANLNMHVMGRRLPPIALWIQGIVPV